jgi:hypothetical protein
MENSMSITITITITITVSNTLPPPQAIQPVMSMPVRRLKFETKACVAVRPAE